MPPSTTTPDPTIVVDLPHDGGSTAVAHLPPDVLDRFYPHEFPANWAEVLTGVFTTLLAVTAMIAAIITAYQLRQARHARHIETYARVSNEWNGKEFRHVRRSIRQYVKDCGGAEQFKDKMVALGEDFDDEYWDLLTALDFFENLALQVKNRAISFKMADNALGVVICQYWAMLGPFIYSERDAEPQDDYYYTEFELLAEKISKKHKYQFPWKDTEHKPLAEDAPNVPVEDALQQN